MRRISEIFKRYSLPLFSGILIGTSYIPFPPWALAFCYVPLWLWSLRLMRENPSPADSKKLSMILFRGGWWTQFILSLIGFYWIAHVTHEFGFLPWVVAIPVLLLFAAVMHLYVAVSLWAGFWLSRKLSLKPGATLLSWAALLALGEMFWPSIFPWNMGYPLFYGKLAWAQWADVVGFQGLSFLAYAINAVIALLWLWRKQQKKQAFRWGVALLILFLALTWWGGRQKQLRWSQTDHSLQTLIVQANIGNLEKYYAEKGLGYQQYIIDQYFQLTREGLAAHPEAQIIVWPESAFPDYLDSFALSRPYPQQLVNFIHEIKRPILTGAYSKDPPGPGRRKDYNSIFLFDENGRSTQAPYHKTHLLIFGETLPFVDEFPWLAKINPGGAGFGRGSGAATLSWSSVILGPQICYDSLYPNFSRAIARKGAQVLVNVTNDSWFGEHGEPYQHLYMTLGRALEVRRPLIRSTNTGISTVVLADGTVLETSPKFQTWAGDFDVKYQSQPETTFFTRFGAWLAPMLCAILLLTLLCGRNGKDKDALGKA
jgi:apolipoprotein N-acyltransferase